jgi:pyruvate dehydrogenase (quinone)
MPRTVADQFADILVAAGIRRVYGIVSDSLNGICDAIRRQGKIEWHLIMPDLSEQHCHDE